MRWCSTFCCYWLNRRSAYCIGKWNPWNMQLYIIQFAFLYYSYSSTVFNWCSVSIILHSLEMPLHVVSIHTRRVAVTPTRTRAHIHAHILVHSRAPLLSVFSTAPVQASHLILVVNILPPRFACFSSILCYNILCQFLAQFRILGYQFPCSLRYSLLVHSGDHYIQHLRVGEGHS